MFGGLHRRAKTKFQGPHRTRRKPNKIQILQILENSQSYLKQQRNRDRPKLRHGEAVQVAGNALLLECHRRLPAGPERLRRPVLRQARDLGRLQHHSLHITRPNPKVFLLLDSGRHIFMRNVMGSQSTSLFRATCVHGKVSVRAHTKPPDREPVAVNAQRRGDALSEYFF